ncbi:hypothetical protein [Glacieibacterium frigidum]|uniref:Uncharacterized protein n=1 Tax=Glacieibacterium frigidum TaxID=2593303 RepID=A0A552UID6_9SPHN|nr:hypothetical protein [Glacieibacterium frigidum]TRW17989.1 hypothetical protein FMM06_07675 [Glacieibacterium frigidum]
MAESSSADVRDALAHLEPDAHGQAALLLAESTLHMLVEAGVLFNAQALEVVRTAAEVKVEVAEAAGESKKRMKQSLVLLESISETFRANDVAAPTFAA